MCRRARRRPSKSRARGHHAAPQKQLRDPQRSSVRLPPALSGPGLLTAGPEDPAQDLRLPHRRARVALRNPHRPESRDAAGTQSRHARAGRRAVAQGRQGGRRPHALGRSLQAVGPPRLRTGPPPQAPSDATRRPRPAAALALQSPLWERSAAAGRATKPRSSRRPIERRSARPSGPSLTRARGAPRLGPNSIAAPCGRPPERRFERRLTSGSRRPRRGWSAPARATRYKPRRSRGPHNRSRRQRSTPA